MSNWFAGAKAARAFEAKEVRQALGGNVATQLLIGALSAATINPEPFQMWWMSAVAYWPTVFVLLLHRGDALTNIDLILMAWGFFACPAILFFVGGLVWYLRGFESYMWQFWKYVLG
jgi:hypothetical protein